MVRTKYGRKKIREEKKQKIELIDKIREEVLRMKKDIEAGKLNSYGFVRKTINNASIASMFKADIGEVDKCLMALHREGLVSNKYGRGGYRDVSYDEDNIQKEETKIYQPLFNITHCPICNSKLEESVSRYSFTKMKDYKYECNHGCFIQKYSDSGEFIKVYDDHFDLTVEDHNSIRGNIKRNIEKKIKFWKTNHRYVARNLLGAWEE